MQPAPTTTATNPSREATTSAAGVPDEVTQLLDRAEREAHRRRYLVRLARLSQRSVWIGAVLALVLLLLPVFGAVDAATWHARVVPLGIALLLGLGAATMTLAYWQTLRRRPDRLTVAKRVDQSCGLHGMLLTVVAHSKDADGSAPRRLHAGFLSLVEQRVRAETSRDREWPAFGPPLRPWSHGWYATVLLLSVMLATALIMLGPLEVEPWSSQDDLPPAEQQQQQQAAKPEDEYDEAGADKQADQPKEDPEADEEEQPTGQDQDDDPQRREDDDPDEQQGEDDDNDDEDAPGGDSDNGGEDADDAEADEDDDADDGDGDDGESGESEDEEPQETDATADDSGDASDTADDNEEEEDAEDQANAEADPESESETETEPEPHDAEPEELDEQQQQEEEDSLDGTWPDEPSDEESAPRVEPPLPDELDPLELELEADDGDTRDGQYDAYGFDPDGEVGNERVPLDELLSRTGPAGIAGQLARAMNPRDANMVESYYQKLRDLLREQQQQDR